MKIVTIELHGKKVILLSGARAPSQIEAPDKLLDTARRNPDAVAFGYVSGTVGGCCLTAQRLPITDRRCRDQQASQA